MNTPDTITITISRGRWSISRSMDLDLMLGSTIDAAEELFALFEEAHHAFTLAGRHLDPLWNNAPVERVISESVITSEGRTILCPHCKYPMARTAADSWCCYDCGEVWSVIPAKGVDLKDDLPPSCPVPIQNAGDDPGTT